MDLRVLFVEDSVNDVELMLRRLGEAGIEAHWQRVQTDAALREVLTGEPWELALVDYNLPGFGGLEALAVLAAAAPDVPVITVSGAITEETAVATITAGAVDYVLKDNLTRLAPAARRAVEGAALRRQERRAAAQARQTMYAIEHSSQAIVYVSEHGVILYANAAAQRLRGVSPAEQLIGAEIWGWSPALDETRWGALWRAAAQHPIVDFEATLRLAGGEERLISATLDYHERDAEAFVIVYARDITAQRQAEERAAESEALYRRIVEMAGEGILATDGEYRTTFVNPQMAAMLGYETEEMLGRVDSDFMFEEDKAQQAAQRQARAQGLAGAYERRLKSKDGSEVWMHVSAVAESGPEGEFLGSFALCTDITERKRAEEALRQSEAQLRTLVDVLPDFVWLKDPGGIYRSCNRRFARFFGTAEKDIVGKTDYDFTDADQAASFQQRDVIAMAAAAPTIEEEIVFAEDGHREVLETIKTPVRASDGRLIGLLGVGRDITERKQSEEGVRRQAEQLRRTVEGAVLAMGHMVESRDPYTAGHERRVAELATAIAAELGMEGEALDALRLGGLIHDIGKIAVPAEILAKPGRLSTVEFELIKQHPATGFDILGAIDFGRPVAEIVLQHHERLDGSGYPRALTAKDILPEARILAVADVVEAMSSHRPYRAALGMEAALAEVREHAGVTYDADVVAACVRLVEEQGFQFTP